MICILNCWSDVLCNCKETIFGVIQEGSIRFFELRPKDGLSKLLYGPTHIHIATIMVSASDVANVGSPAPRWGTHWLSDQGTIFPVEDSLSSWACRL